jgi:hypothetical protein
MSGAIEIGKGLRGADVLFIVPPFAHIDRPAIGVHILQGVARRAGFEAQVLYANLLFCAFFDEGTHHTLSHLPFELMLGERMFARAAYGGGALGRDGGAGLLPHVEALRQGAERRGIASSFSMDALRAIEGRVPAWLDSFVPAAARHRLVGCTSSFEQNAAAIAILGRVKAASPATLTMMGGANCEGEMAEGVLSLTPHVDHVFAGESEETFRAFLEAVGRGERPAQRILHGAPCHDLDGLPVLDYADYYAQLAAFLPKSATYRHGLSCLSYETSRGCWWGEKRHCTFCGLNGEGMAARSKSPERVIAELKTLLAAHPVADASQAPVAAGGVRQGQRGQRRKLVVMTDNIMPHAFFRTLLPRLADELGGATLMYEMKANLSLRHVLALVAAGVTEIQPGIEALSTGLLRLMAKGTTASQNLALLRYASAAGLYLYWNLLVGFPGDTDEHYHETLELLPLLHHLQPPVSAFPVIFDRFSPYFDRAESFGIRGLRPLPCYAEVLPETAAIAKVACHFDGDCDSAARAHPELVHRIHEEIGRWRQRFHGPAPAELRVTRAGAGYRLIDRRGLGDAPEEEPLDEAQAQMVLVPRPVRAVARQGYAWALARRLVVERDDRFVPLAVAEPGLLAELEERAHARPELSLAT